MWMTDPEFLAQAAHTLLGMVAVSLPLALGGLHAALFGTALVLLYGVVKELFVDPKVEADNPFFWEGAKDLAFIAGGAGLVWLLRWLL